MFYVLKFIYEGYKNFDETHRDKRSEGYLLTDYPIYTIIITALYYVFVKHVGPNMMADREPFELKGVIIVYNVLQVVCNAFLFGKAIYHFMFDNPYDDLSCMMPIIGKVDHGRMEFRLVYFYSLLKIVDLMDTIFFVLRKRSNQITFLHVYHHILMVLVTFAGLRFLPGGHASAMGVMNSFIHVIMYFYYLVTAFRPGLKNSLWWKKHLTQLQIMQFFLINIHYMRALFNSSCEYPKLILVFGIFQTAVLTLLFLNFYIRAYVAKGPVKIN